MNLKNEQDLEYAIALMHDQKKEQEELRQEELRQEELRQEELRQEEIRQEELRQEELRQEELRQEENRHPKTPSDLRKLRLAYFDKQNNIQKRRLDKNINVKNILEEGVKRKRH